MKQKTLKPFQTQQFLKCRRINCNFYPIIRDYPQNFVQQIDQYLNREIHFKQLPNLVGYVDQTQNPDYRQPSWHEIYLEGQGLKLF